MGGRGAGVMQTSQGSDISINTREHKRKKGPVSAQHLLEAELSLVTEISHLHSRTGKKCNKVNKILYQVT